MMADVGLGSIELVVEDDSINKYDVKKSHDESHLNETDRKQATNAGVDSFNIIKALLPLLDSRKKDLVNEEKRAGNVLERAFLKLDLQSEEQYPTPGNAEVRTESSWNAYVEGIVLGCGDAFWMKVRKLLRISVSVSCILQSLIYNAIRSFNYTCAGGSKDSISECWQIGRYY